MKKLFEAESPSDSSASEALKPGKQIIRSEKSAFGGKDLNLKRGIHGQKRIDGRI
jgi:hypothetical protein